MRGGVLNPNQRSKTTLHHKVVKCEKSTCPKYDYDYQFDDERQRFEWMTNNHPYQPPDNQDNAESFHSILTCLFKIEVVLQPNHFPDLWERHTRLSHSISYVLSLRRWRIHDIWEFSVTEIILIHLFPAFPVTNAHAIGDNGKIVIRSFLILGFRGDTKSNDFVSGSWTIKSRYIPMVELDDFWHRFRVT